jgi:predicted ABC-type transport system involved in lysophospholipase L1 biosynthesis ATPase subunit
VQPAGAAGNAAELALLNKMLEHLSDEAIKRKRRRSIVCAFVSFVISLLYTKDAVKSLFKS